MSELEESVVRSQAILMMARNHQKENQQQEAKQ